MSKASAVSISILTRSFELSNRGMLSEPFPESIQSLPIKERNTSHCEIQEDISSLKSSPTGSESTSMKILVAGIIVDNSACNWVAGHFVSSCR